MMSHCKNCEHFTADSYYPGFGSCALIADVNKSPGEQPADTERAYSWDYESYISGHFVGERFGCIHFKELAT
jgi:hypothetical protein